MNKKLFYNNPIFRLAAPLLFGIVIYLLILMFFDSVEMLANNFFSREVLFVIGLTFVIFELNRLVIVLLNLRFKSTDKLLLRAGIQYFLSFMLTIGAVSLILYQYFVNIEGFSTIHTELITFNSIYLFAALFYHLYYFSMQFLFRKNDDLYQSEQIKRDSLELELTAYKNQINPEFLFQTLEIIIEQLNTDKKKADELIDQLAKVYRYTLDNQNNELISLEQEINSLNPLMAIFQTKYPGSLKIEKQGVPTEDVFLVPGTLQILFEHAVINNMVSKNIPLVFNVSTEASQIQIKYKKNERITGPEKNEARIEHLIKTYQYLKPDEFQRGNTDNNLNYKIPLIAVEEE